MENDFILELINISKSFPGVRALEDVNIKVKKGTVHVIVGENGAGKSTLMKIINGNHQPDTGKIVYKGKEMVMKDTIMTGQIGISMIYQELNFIPELTVAENLFLGREPYKITKKFLDNKALYSKAAELLKKEGLQYSPYTKMKDLSVSDIQMLEIVKAVSIDASLIIMDEPTSAITDREVDNLFKKIEQLKSKGVAIIYISHKLNEVFRIADEISVLRDGVIIETREASAFDHDSVISMMVGRQISNIYPKEKVKIGDVTLRVENLCNGKIFNNISFEARRGEIVGIAGLMGAGRTEVSSAIFGMDSYDCGKIFMEDKEVKIRCVNDAIKNGIIMLTEDRKKYGLVLKRSIRENIALPNLKQFVRWRWLNIKKEESEIESVSKSLEVKAPDLNTPADSLSGGNQQKVVIAKWLLARPKVLILDEPTRGIDVGAKYEIYKLMVQMAEQGMTIIMISSELPELIGMSDRIYVMRQGELAGELNAEEFSQESIMRIATGGRK